ncbi:unnamed protein product [Sphagnum troendelagicum]|uniref:Uncharacterized protein n=1 Tax=Sphagnum troendelagicum TaxID=128251 RepID=A0ABP0T9Y2_9BRYO
MSITYLLSSMQYYSNLIMESHISRYAPRCGCLLEDVELQRGLLAELENPGDEPEVTKDELESGAFRSACIKEIPLVASVQDVMSACLEEEHTLEVFRSLSRQDDELVAELEELENLADLDDVRSAQLSRLRTCAAGLATRLAAVQRRRPRCVVAAAFSLRLAALVPDRIFWQFLTISPVSQQI